jgi:Cys-tRNA(Pro)/Cys-tRNA(Cys) deacylase
MAWLAVSNPRLRALRGIHWHPSAGTGAGGFGSRRAYGPAASVPSACSAKYHPGVLSGRTRARRGVGGCALGHDLWLCLPAPVVVTGLGMQRYVGQTAAMAGTPATVALTAAAIAFTEHAYEHDPGNRNFGLEAAEALGLDPEQVFKTLLAEVDGELIVGIVPVTGKLDLGALAKAAGGKRATMADPAVAQRRTGYVVGGISPIGQKTRHRTVLDETAELFDVVYVSGGRRGLDLGLAPANLIAVTEATVAAIAKD